MSESGLPLYCLPAVACCCAGFLFPLALFSVLGPGSAQRQTHRSLARERERGERVKETEKERRSVS